MANHFVNVAVPAIMGAFIAFYFARCSFAPKGILVTKSLRVTGTRAKLIGMVCILLGFACVYFAILAFQRFMALPAAHNG